MSTKTNFKRIALVAAASLGLGVLSSVQAQASVIGSGVATGTNGTATTGKSDTTTAASIAVSFFANAATDSAVITLAAGAKPTGAATFDTSSVRFVASDTSAATMSTTIAYTTTGTSGSTGTQTAFTTTGGYGSNSDSVTAKFNSYAVIKPTSASVGTVAGTVLVFLDSAMARTIGTYTIPYSVELYSNGVLDSTKSQSGTLSIVVSQTGAAAAGSVTAAATSSAVLYGGSSFVAGNTVDSSLSLISTPDATADAVIRVTQKTAAGLASQESITVTIDKGNVGSSSSAASGKSVTFVGDASGVNDIFIFADGSAGLATITIKTTSVTFSNKTITWYGGTVATITATQLGKTLGGSSSSVILAIAKDASGNQILGDTSVYAYAADRTIISTGTSATTGTACTYVAAYGGQLCSLAGATDGTTTVTLWNTGSTTTRTVSSNAVTFVVNTKAAAAIKIATDKATYAPGEVAYVRVWAVDAAGSRVAPGTYTNLLASGGITSTVATGNGSDTTTAVTFDLGFTTAAGNGYASDEAIKLYKVYMPYSGGDITFSATGGTSLPTAGQVAVTTKVSVTDNGAAALAAVTALASQVSAFITKINAQITTLTDLVMKIQKKVKA